VRIPVNKETVLANNIVPLRDSTKIVPFIDIRIKGNALIKNRLLMLDIIANNNWERPIYFTGGAFGDDDYIWMKDYLQLDGLCYKLVPIQTKVDRANPFDMGRVDAEKMYQLVTKWQWGNSGDTDIYHDVETRKNGITYRGNLARLIEALINVNEVEKAEEIADLAMEKMPVDVFGYYTLLEPYISAYYELNSTSKARQLFIEVSKKYQENLNYYSSLTLANQRRLFEEIYTDIERYRGLVDVIIINENDEEFITTEMQMFNATLRLFNTLIGDDVYDSPVRSDTDIPNDSNNKIDIN
jgi:tetratricopeptide (TPR) repeat protein